MNIFWLRHISTFYYNVSQSVCLFVCLFVIPLWHLLFCTKYFTPCFLLVPLDSGGIGYIMVFFLFCTIVHRYYHQGERSEHWWRCFHLVYAWSCFAIFIALHALIDFQQTFVTCLFWEKRELIDFGVKGKGQDYSIAKCYLKMFVMVM